MSNKLGFLLSLVFLIHSILLAMDLLTYQTAFARLELVASNVRGMIVEDRSITRAASYTLELGGQFSCIENCQDIQRGDFVVFKVSFDYQPVFIKKDVDNQKITMQKSVVV